MTIVLCREDTSLGATGKVRKEDETLLARRVFNLFSYWHWRKNHVPLLQGQ